MPANFMFMGQTLVSGPGGLKWNRPIVLGNTASRAKTTMTFPANFMLIGAMNPWGSCHYRWINLLALPGLAGAHRWVPR